MTMKNPDKIKQEKKVFNGQIIQMFLKHKLGEFLTLKF